MKYVYTVNMAISGLVEFSAPVTATARELRELAEEHTIKLLAAKSSKKLRFGGGRVTAGRQLKGARPGYRTMQRRGKR